MTGLRKKIHNKMDNFLHSLLTTATVSGFETAGSQVFADYVRPYVDAISTDELGNTIARIDGNQPGKRILIEAHIDEIGFQVLYVDDNGCVWLRKNGGIDVQCMPGSRVLIYAHTGIIPGIIGKQPIHFNTPGAAESVPTMQDLWVDTGMEADEVRQLIHTGDIVVTDATPTLLGQRITSRALDDKIGVYIVSQVLRRLSAERDSLHGTVYGAAATQEEVGCRGIQVCANTIQPDVSISLDVDFATDMPNCQKNKYGDISLGKGVIVSCNLDSSPALVRAVEQIASREEIAIQLSARPSATGGTDAARLRTIGNGIQTLLLGIPCRYMHTPVEMCDVRDVDAAIRLIVGLCLGF